MEVVSFLTAMGLFIGQSKEFFEPLRDLAEMRTRPDENVTEVNGNDSFTGAALGVRRLSSRVFRSQPLQLTFQRSRIQCELRL
jgi:hypothetical protein